VKANQARFLAMGAYLFVAEHGFNLKKDSIALAATTDQFEAIRYAGSDAANYGHDNAQVIAWLRELDKAEPFVMTGAGMDYVPGRPTQIDAFAIDGAAAGVQYQPQTLPGPLFPPGQIKKPLKK
jgi:hypothetical protein